MTYRGSGYAIDISPSAICDLIYGDSAKWLGSSSPFVSTETHGSGINDVPGDFYAPQMHIYHPVNYKGLEEWEKVAYTYGPDSNGELDQPAGDFAGGFLKDAWWVSADHFNKKVENISFIYSHRLPGWSITNPHESAQAGYNSFRESDSPESIAVPLIKNGSIPWGGANAALAFGEGESDMCGRKTKGFIGLKASSSSRITKIVTGLFPGVTYRLYFSIASRPGNNSNLSPTGCRVYVVEPHQSSLNSDDVSNELIAYGEFTQNACRFIDYNQNNNVGATGKQVDFSMDKPYHETNLKHGSSSVSQAGNDAKNHSTVSDKFKVFYVEFTPTRGANCVEIRLENAFIANHFGSTPPTNWTKISQSQFFNYGWNEHKWGDKSLTSPNDDYSFPERHNWTEYHGAWASNGETGADTTVFVDSVFIKATRPLWVEKIKVASNCNQQAFQILLTNGDPVCSPCYNYFVKAPWATADIIKKMVDSKACPPELDQLFYAKQTNGWFITHKPNNIATLDDQAEYEIDVIRQHTHIFLWDPFVVNLANQPAALGSPVVSGDFSSGNSGLQVEQNSENFNTIPNLTNGHYVGFSCWWEGKLWRLKDTERSTALGDVWARRPGYDKQTLVTGKWNWQDHFFSYMPTGNTTYNSKWENITDFTGAEMLTDACNVTNDNPKLGSSSKLQFLAERPALNSLGDLVSGKRADGFSVFSQSDGMWYSGHVLDAILRRPYRSLHEFHMPKWYSKWGFWDSDANSREYITAADRPYYINSAEVKNFSDTVPGLGWNVINDFTFNDFSNAWSTQNDGYIFHGTKFHYLTHYKNIPQTSGVSNDARRGYSSLVSEIDNGQYKGVFYMSPKYPYTDEYYHATLTAPDYVKAVYNPDDNTDMGDAPLLLGDDAGRIVGLSFDKDFSACPGALNTYSIVSTGGDALLEPSDRHNAQFKQAFHRRYSNSYEDVNSVGRHNPYIADHIYGAINPICLKGMANMYSNISYYSADSSSSYNIFSGWSTGLFFGQSVGSFEYNDSNIVNPLTTDRTKTLYYE
jgi:hypothetical protein